MKINKTILIMLSALFILALPVCVLSQTLQAQKKPVVVILDSGHGYGDNGNTVDKDAN
jgi:hypothetical protein